MGQGFMIKRDEGTSIAYLGGVATFKIGTEETGSWGVAIETFPAGFASALHVHHGEDSAFFVLRGRMRVRCGDNDMEAEPEALVYLPRDVPHAFKVVGDEPASWLNIQGPTGDFRRFVEEIGLPVESPAWPPPEADVEPALRLAAATRHGVEIVGGPPWT